MASSLKEYLKKYQSTDEVEKKKKKKKKQKKLDMTGVLVVDEDPVWQKPVVVEEENGDDSTDEEKPQVDEDIEVKRMKRLEQANSQRPYGVISDDGSGWVSVADVPQKLIESYSNIDDLSLPESGQKLPGTEIDDLSPPRKRRSRNDTPSPKPDQKPSGTESMDLSPPRQRQRRYHSPPKPDQKPSGTESMDLSPPRQRQRRYHSPSPKPDQKPSGTESMDLSPPRQRQRRYHSPSPKHVKILSNYSGLDDQNMKSKDQKVDLSPPRRRRARLDTPSPEHIRTTSELRREDLDLSPQRRRNHLSHSALSPPRGVRPDSSSRDDSPYGPDISPRRKSRTVDAQSSLSDLSPPRKNRRDISPTQKVSKESKSLADQRKTGLVSGKDVTEEVMKKRKEELLRFKAKDPSITGQGAEPVYRDKKTGQRLSKDEFVNSQKKDEKPKEVKLEWGKGLAQKREAEARKEELELEKAKPFARTRDDPDLDRMLKDRLRWGDPMAHLVKKKHTELVLPDMGDDEKMKASGFIVPQEIPHYSWLRRGLEAAPNRYGIKPGRHWDGVDRSTGFEQAMFKRMNEKQATEREAYLWSVSDM